MSILGKTEEPITQFSEEIEGRVTKIRSQEFSRTESRIFGAQSKLDFFLLNTEIQTLSGNAPGNSRNTDTKIQEPTGGRSQNDSRPEMESSVSRSRNSIDSDPDETSHSITVEEIAMFRGSITELKTTKLQLLRNPLSSIKRAEIFLKN